MTRGIIIQARTTSTRLPNKILMELPYGSGTTVLQQVIRRLRKSREADVIIIATTTDREDDAVVNISVQENVPYFRGSRENVLERFYLTAQKNGLDVIVRITSDCPCIDPGIVDSAIKQHCASHADYTSNTLKRTFPRGLDVEVMTLSALRKAHEEASEDFEREHVTPYIYRTNPGAFKISDMVASLQTHAPDIRVTLDTEEDYALLCAVYGFLYPHDNFFGAEKIVGLFNDRPWFKLINKKISQKNKFNTLKEELTEAVSILEKQDLPRARDIINDYLSNKL